MGYAVAVFLQAAFVLPIVHGIMEQGIPEPMPGSLPVAPRALIMAPTRELCTQIYNQAKKFASKTGVLVKQVYGGTQVQFQMMSLQDGCHILVGTPGRLNDFLTRGYVSSR